MPALKNRAHYATWITGDSALPETRGDMLIPWAKMNWITLPVLESRGGRRWQW